MSLSASSDLVLHDHAVSISSRASTQTFKFRSADSCTFPITVAASVKKMIAAVNAQWTVDIGVQR